MRPGGLRPLTPAEVALSREMFGTDLDTGRVRILALPLWRRAFVPCAHLIVWPRASAWQDFSAAPLDLQAVFVHELTHIWQAQTGINLLWGKLMAGDGPGAYAYDLGRDDRLSALNIEQQAMVMQHAFLAARGAPTPLAAADYTRVLAAWRATDAARPRTV